MRFEAERRHTLAWGDDAEVRDRERAAERAAEAIGDAMDEEELIESTQRGAGGDGGVARAAEEAHAWATHDEAWAAYRRRLLAEIAPGGRARPNREGLAGVKALPAFRPPRPPPGGGGGGAGLRESELTQWASEHLSGTVLKSLHELVVSEPMPVMEG